MPTIAHISDLHLQSTVPARQAQVEPILTEINRRKPDHVVITGDLTDDGWKDIQEVYKARTIIDARLDCNWSVIPGNHDVGNFVSLQTNNSTDDLTEHSRWFAEAFEDKQLDHFEHFLGPWTLLGLNGMIFGTNTPEELAQWRRPLKLQTSQPWDSRYLALFNHAPLFIDLPTEMAEADADYWLGPEGPRQQVWSMLLPCNLRLVASGHVHQTRLTQVDGIHIAWAPPASGTWVHAPGLPNPPMPEKTGFFLHHLGDDGSVRSELIECAPMLKLYHHQP